MSAPSTFADLKLREKEAKKEIILQAAIQVFSEKSLHKASLREIAEVAGISHASIYRYFQDKQTLFLQAFLLGVQELGRMLDSLIDSGPRQDLLELTAQTLLDYLRENEHYFTMMTQFMLQGGLSAQSLQDLNRAMKSFLDRIETISRMAGAKTNARYLAHTFFACINGILITFYNYPGRNRQELNQHMWTLALIFIQMFKDGLSTGNFSQHLPPNQFKEP